MIDLDKRESLYKQGDLVTIRPRMFQNSMYQCGYIDDMLIYTDQQAMIIRVIDTMNPRDLSVEQKAYLINVDGHKYTWSAEMFQETYQNPQSPYWKYIKLRIFTQDMIAWLLAHCTQGNDNVELNFISDSPLLDAIDYTNGTYDILKKIDEGKDLRKQLSLFSDYLKNQDL